MTIKQETLWDKFFNRLPSSEANDAIRALKKGGSYKEIDFFTLKEAEQDVAHYRAMAKQAIKDYRRWQAGRALGNYFAVFRYREGAVLRSHAKTMANIFLESKKDYADLSKLIVSSIEAETAKEAKSNTPTDKGGRNG